MKQDSPFVPRTTKASYKGSGFFQKLARLPADGLTAQLLASWVGTVALSPLLLLPVLVYAYDANLNFGPDMAGWVSSSALVGLATATLLVSFRVKHWPMGRVSVIGLMFMLVFTIPTLFWHQRWVFFILTLVAGFGGGLSQAAVAAALSRTIRSERAFAIFTSFQFFYPGLGAYFLPRLLGSGGLGVVHGFNLMQIGQIVLILLALLVAPVVGLFEIHDDASIKPSGGNTHGVEIFAILRGSAALSIVGIMVYGASNGAVWAYSEGIGRTAGLSLYKIGDIITFANMVAGVAALGVAWLGNRMGHYIPLMAGILGQLLSMCILLGFPTPTGYIAGTLVFIVSWAVAFPYFLSIQSDLDSSGSVVTFGQFANLVGTVGGPSTAAFFVGSQGNFEGAIWVSMVMTLLSLLPMVIVPILSRREKFRSEAAVVTDSLAHPSPSRAVNE